MSDPVAALTAALDVVSDARKTADGPQAQNLQKLQGMLFTVIADLTEDESDAEGYESSQGVRSAEEEVPQSGEASEGGEDAGG